MATGTIRFHLIEKIIVQNELTELFMDEPLVTANAKCLQCDGLKNLSRAGSIHATPSIPRQRA
jgi:hypothetical protein